MASPLLTTKLFRPPAKPGLVIRPRLIEKLDQGLARGARLTLVSAPAGYGKTTLVQSWTASHPDWELAWLSLDEADNDPGRFLRYLVAALQTVDPRLGEELVALLEHPSPPLEECLTGLVNQLADRPGSLGLVLEDYHRITSLAVHQWLDGLLERLPPGLHLIITTRSDPLLRLARLRGRGQLSEVRSEDLRFTSAEAEAFLKGTMGMGLDAAAVERLAAQTEGWVAGLQLAALSLEGHAEPERWVAGFGGGDRYVMDYLVEEVLSRQSEAVQRFLLATSCLDRLCAPLCDAILKDEGSGMKDEASHSLLIPHPSPRFIENSGEAGSAFILEQLERANLFVVPLDNQRTWYRYHQLFAELLAHRARRQMAAEIPDLHRRAAIWLEANGFAAEAIRHALAGQDDELAVGMITRVVSTAVQWSHGEVNVLMSWLTALPPRVLEEHPNLEIYLVRALLVTGRFDEAKQVIERVDRQLRKQAEAGMDVRELQGEIALNSSAIESILGDLPRVKQLASEALEKIPETSLYPRSRAYFMLGIAHDLDLEFPEAIRAYEQALVLASKAGDYLAHGYTVADLAWIFFSLGQLTRSIETLQPILELEKQGGQPVPILGPAYVQLGVCYYERNQLEDAEAALQACLERLRLGSITDKYGWYTFTLATIRQARGDLEGARSAYKTAQKILAAYPFGEGYLLRMREFQVRCWLFEGELDKASRWAREYEQICGGPASLYKEYADQGFVRVLVAEGRHETALDWLDRWIPGAEAGGRRQILAAWHAWRAVCHHALGHATQALADLERCLALAQPEGYIRTILDVEGMTISDC